MESLRGKKCFIFDMDGTIYLGGSLIDGAKNLLEQLEEKGILYIFLTNNSSKSRSNYQKKLKDFGIEVAEDKIFTSGEATRIYIKSQGEKKNVFLLGNEDLTREFQEDGFILEGNSSYDYVVLGFDTTLTYDKIWKACDLVKDGVEFLATHPDYVCPLAGGKTMPDTGAMIKMFEAASGRTPKVIGKPNKLIVESIMTKYDLDRDDIVMVGDRLYTDIKLGENAGVDSILVLSGEARVEDLADTEVKPTHVMESVKDLYSFLSNA